MPGPGDHLTRPDLTQSGLTQPGPDGGSRGAVDAYVGRVAAGLSGPASVRRAILAELRDGLLEAADSHQAAGLPPGDAAQAATGTFGDPHTLAASFAPELAASRARYVALAICGTGPLVGLVWLTAMVTSNGGPALLEGLVRHDPAGVLLALPLVAAAITMAALSAAVTVAATSRLGRYVTHPPRLATGAAATVALGAVTADIVLLGMLTTQALATPAALAWPLAALAATVSSLRLLLAARAARRCLTLRATLAEAG